MKDIDALTDRKENLSPAKRALLELRLKKKREATPRIPSLVQCLRTEAIPLSFAQQRLWFLHQWEPGSTQYTIPFAFRLQGPLHIAALEKALNALVARHESLRTTFTLEAESPHQHIHKPQANSLSIVQVTHDSSEMREAKIRQIIEHEIQQPFDLSRGPLFRASLISVTQQDYVLILTLHHIITDGWSMGILYKELSLLYNAYLSDTIVSLPALPIQYADFSVWQRRWLQDEILDRQLRYWKSQLDGMPSFLELPMDFLRPPVQLHKGASQTLDIDVPLTQALQALSQQQGCTLFMTLLAAYQVLLARYTNQNDIVVGSPIANRNQQELEGVVGLFVNTLVLRTQLSHNLTFRQVLARVQKVCVDAYTNQDLPFEKLVEQLHPARDPSRTPLIQTLFQLQRGNQRTTSFTGLKVDWFKVSTSTSKMDLSVSFVEQSYGLTGRVEYDTALFTSATITHLIELFQNLLKGIASNPDQLLGELPLLSIAEQTKILEIGNSRSQPYPEHHCVHQIFEVQIAKIPEAIAVVNDDEQITYQQLNQRATLLAGYLQQLGVGPERRVGIYLDRSADMVVALLGILKVGGAYVPLDPAYPRERVTFMIQNAGIDVILTQAHLRDSFDSLYHFSSEPPHTRYRKVSLDTDWPTIAQAHVKFAPPNMTTDNLAYVMYTSGSTGSPKGVGIVHRAIVRLVKGPDFIPFSHKDVYLQVASLSFDAATFELWGCLLNGARLVLWPEVPLSIDTMGHVLQRHRISTLWLTAALFHQMVEQQLKGFDTVKYLLIGGDRVSPIRARMALQLLEDVQLINGYGPTENTTFTCCYPITMPKLIQHKSVPIGRPIANTHVFVLDRNQHLVPIDVHGELYIGGAGLARGYLDQPTLTAERFVPDAFSQQLGGRLYRSGDMARFRQDSTIEFLGRHDHQVKIRGFRIELGEVQATLSRHPAVRETVILACEEESREKRLVAYIVPHKGATPSIADLRTFLTDTLPSYMIPSDFVWLDAFPLTANGKIDREKFLPVDPKLQGEESYEAPRNATEVQITAIWETLLGKHPIRITDNFFDMGGESLLAVRLCAELGKTFPGKVTIPMIFQSQTIEQLAKIIQGEKERAPWNWLVPIQSKGENPPVFCVLFGDTFRPYLHTYPAQPLYMLFNQSQDGTPAIYLTVEDIAAQYIQEIRTVQAQGPYFLAGYSFGGLVAYEMAQQLYQQGQAIAFLGLVDPTCPSGTAAVPTVSERLKRIAKIKGSSGKANPDRRLRIFRIMLLRISSGFKWRLKGLITMSTWSFRLKKIVARIYFALDRPLPPSLRGWYRTVINQRASRHYVPQDYSGKITVFQSSPRPKEYWSKLCQNNIEVCDIPGKHLEVVREPYAQAFLTTFLDSLDNDQKNKTEVRFPQKTIAHS